MQDQMEAELDTQLKAWGNSYGIIVPKAVADKLGMAPGMQIHVKVSFEPARNDPSRLPTWSFGGRSTREILDEEFGRKE